MAVVVVPMKIRNQLLLNNGMILGVLLVVVATMHQGSVTLLLEALGEDRPSALAGTEDVLAIRVVDTGIGIPEQRREAIFAAFQQVDGSISRKYGGTGLTISRQLTTLLGGILKLDSSDKSGSTFSLYLPTGVGDADCAAQSSSVAAIEIPDQPHESNHPLAAQTDAGADRYMSNPVDRDELLHTIEALLLSKSHRQVLERTA